MIGQFAIFDANDPEAAIYFGAVPDDPEGFTLDLLTARKLAGAASYYLTLFDEAGALIARRLIGVGVPAPPPPPPPPPDWRAFTLFRDIAARSK